MKKKPVMKIRGLRFVLTKQGELIDQYGRIFKTDKHGRPTEPTGRVGTATH